MKQELLHLSAVELARRIREREISVTEVVEAHIQRTKQVNPHINAVIIPMYEQALEAARTADAQIAASGTDNLPPLFGVPITMKDCWPVEGVRFVGGSWYLRDNVADHDAPAVKLLRDAGAIIIGKTNLPDGCWLAESTNPVFGQTNNPHNVSHSAGGSSGGEGAIIAAGGSPLGLGSDIAGSVRIPAAFNGCVSLKPSAGRVPSEEHMPLPPEEIFSWNTAGPMARRVEDLALALQILSRTPVQDYRDISLEGRPLSALTPDAIFPLHREVAETVMMAAGALRSAGMVNTTRNDFPLQEVGYTYAGIFRKYGSPAFRKFLGGGKVYNTWEELQAHWRGQGRITRRVLFFTAFMDVVGWVASLRGLDNFRKLEDFKARILASMKPGGVLVLPLHPLPVPRHNWSYFTLRQVPYAFMFNALGMPAAVVPIRYGRKNLPYVVQVVGHPGEDEVVLAVAAELERVFGGWQMAAL
ncbi:MAG: amidase [Anaerolineae bacterium]|nr:amidase [Anaerolineae bacterium]